MNQDQIKEKLLNLRPGAGEFTVILSGKKSRKVNGLYRPESREIILHNRNFADDNALFYTALHEFAHHLQFTSSALPISARVHTGEFWMIFHTLLYEAESRGLYRNLFEAIPELETLTRDIKEKILTVDAGLMKELGRLLKRAAELCDERKLSFNDYLDRMLNLPHQSAALMMRSAILDFNPRVGFESMKTLARIKDEGLRDEAQEALLEGQSAYLVKAKYLKAENQQEPLELLKKEKARLERQIQSLDRRLKEVERRIQGLEEGGGHEIGGAP